MSVELVRWFRAKPVLSGALSAALRTALEATGARRSSVNLFVRQTVAPDTTEMAGVSLEDLAAVTFIGSGLNVSGYLKARNGEDLEFFIISPQPDLVVVTAKTEGRDRSILKAFTDTLHTSLGLEETTGDGSLNTPTRKPKIRAFRSRQFRPVPLAADQIVKAFEHAATSLRGRCDTASNEVLVERARSFQVERDNGQLTADLIDAEGNAIYCTLFIHRGQIVSASVTAETLEIASRVLDFLGTSLGLAVMDTYDESSEAAGKVRRIFKRLHSAALILSRRQRGRPPFEIHNEYDVQDLLHALLTVSFDDVRREEPTPSYAGGAARVDFLLKREGIVVEAKLATETHGATLIGPELIVDRHRYANLSVRRIMCVIYDPDGHVINPRGLETDLSGERDGIVMDVTVVPSQR